VINSLTNSMIMSILIFNFHLLSFAEHSSPPISSQLRDLSNSLKMLCSSTSSCLQISEKKLIPVENVEPKTPTVVQNRSINRWDEMNGKSPWEKFSMRGSGMKVWSIYHIVKWLYFIMFFTYKYNLFILITEFYCPRIP